MIEAEWGMARAMGGYFTEVNEFLHILGRKIKDYGFHALLRMQLQNLVGLRRKIMC